MVTELHDAPGLSGSRSDPPGRVRRFTGVLPVTAALLVIGAAAALAFPGVRHELSTSFRHQPAQYVELYFADESNARTCPTTADRIKVVATIRSHLAGSAALPYLVSVTSPASTIATMSQGIVATKPDHTSDFGASLAIPSSAYTVTVSLPGRSEQLVLHCGTDGS